MKIGIDSQPLLGKMTGVGYYASNLVKHLEQIDTKNEYELVAVNFFIRPFRPSYHINSLNFRWGIIKFLPARVFFKLMKWNMVPPIDLFLGKKDVYLFPNFVRWPLLFSNSIIVIYDLSYLLYGQYSQDANRKFLTRYVRRSIKKTSKIVTISENSKQEIIEHYHVKPDDISIIYPAVDHQIFRPLGGKEVKRVLHKYNLNKPYILYTGTIEPRKNIVGILDAYASLPSSLRDSYSLVLAGGKGWQDKDIKAKLDELSHLDIHLTGYVADEDLPPLYTGASVFVYPSHYEGFGMPPLEAMACGTPVITSNNSSLPEVVQEAGIMIEATDTDALTASIQKVLTDQVLADDLRKKGFEQAAKFTWEESAARLKALIEKVGAE
jgi:glycosyltransferase involved in cell wall biosynthesis